MTWTLKAIAEHLASEVQFGRGMDTSGREITWASNTDGADGFWAETGTRIETGASYALTEHIDADGIVHRVLDSPRWTENGLIAGQSIITRYRFPLQFPHVRRVMARFGWEKAGDEAVKKLRNMLISAGRKRLAAADGNK